DVGDALADLADDARTLVARDERGRLRDRAVHAGHVGVAHAGGVDLDLHLARADRAQLDVVDDLELLVAGGAEHGCAHGWLPLVQLAWTDRAQRNRLAHPLETVVTTVDPTVSAADPRRTGRRFSRSGR